MCKFTLGKSEYKEETLLTLPFTPDLKGAAGLGFHPALGDDTSRQ